MTITWTSKIFHTSDAGWLFRWPFARDAWNCVNTKNFESDITHEMAFSNGVHRFFFTCNVTVIGFGQRWAAFNRKLFSWSHNIYIVRFCNTAYLNSFINPDMYCIGEVESRHSDYRWIPNFQPIDWKERIFECCWILSIFAQSILRMMIISNSCRSSLCSCIPLRTMLIQELAELALIIAASCTVRDPIPTKQILPLP